MPMSAACRWHMARACSVRTWPYRCSPPGGGRRRRHISDAAAVMRVCLETSTFRAKLAGIAYYTLFLASHLRQVAPDIELSEFDGARFAPLSQERLDEVRHQGSAADRQTVSLYHRARQFGPARSAFRAYKRLRFMRGVHGFDLFHAMNFMPPAETTVPVLPLIHDISHERFPETHPAERTDWLRKRMAKLDRYPLLNTVSDFSADEISTFYGYPRERIRVTRPGINPIFRHPAPEAAREGLRRSGLEEGRFFLSVGTIEPRKNLATLLEAYARLPAATRQAFPLVHVGQIGWGNVRSRTSTVSRRRVACVSTDTLMRRRCRRSTAPHAPFSFPASTRGSAFPSPRRWPPACR